MDQPTPAVTPDTHAQPSPAEAPGSEFNLRSVATGMVLGGVLSLCNIYAGLKVGWGFNVAITAVIVSFAFWEVMHRTAGTRKWGILENNINMTAAASAASISSAGLVAPIPALAILTGQTLTWPWLVAWTFSVCLVGIAAAIALRKQMILEEKLPFPGGIAAGETLKEIYSQGEEAMKRVKVLVSTAVASIGLKIVQAMQSLQIWGLPFSLPAAGGMKAGETAVTVLSMKNLTFGIEPSFMMIGVGGLVGFRACWSLLLGSVISWGILGPLVINAGWVDLAKAKVEDPWFAPMVKWLLWPGVGMMVASSLTAFAFSWRQILSTFTGKKPQTQDPEEGPSDSPFPDNPRESDVIQPSWFVIFLALSLIASVILQIKLFSISMGPAVIGVLISVLLAVVAARVSGETNVTPVGAMGKVTQLFFGIISPGDSAANLMAANVTGGAASQCAELLHDLKTGMMVGGSPRLLCYAQVFGALIGALAGSAAYLVLIPNPKEQLMTPEWPAPAVAAWLAVAEIFKKGFGAMPPGTINALIAGAVIGIILAIVEKTAPSNIRAYVPSPASIGLGFVIPAYNALSMFIGGILALVLQNRAKDWSSKYLIVSAAGLIAGESLAGVFIAVKKILFP